MGKDLQQGYEERYTWFIDILGFSEAITNPEHKIYIRSVDYFNFILTEMEKPIEQKDFALPDVRYIATSDCIIGSCPANPINLEMLFSKITWLQQNLLIGGFASRGGITKGFLHHEGSRVFGPALVYAVELEKTVKMPIIALSPEVVKDCEVKISESYSLKRWTSKTLINGEEYNYVDFAKYWPIVHEPNDIQLIMKVINEGLSNTKPDVCKIYLWLAQRFNAFVDDCKLKFPYPWLVKIEVNN